MTRTVIEGCAIATVDAAGTEYRDGHVVIEDDRIVAVGAGSAPDGPEADRIDGRGHLATPGLVNCHHHLYQWATRGLAQQATLFEWLVELYPVWAMIDDETCRAASRAGRRSPEEVFGNSRPAARVHTFECASVRSSNMRSLRHGVRCLAGRSRG